MNKYKHNLKLLMIIFFNNVCLRYEECYNTCPLKCGFYGHSYRCFFNCGEDDLAMEFSDNVFHDKGKFPPFPLTKLKETTCNNDIDDCDHCEWYVDKMHCKIFTTLRDRIKYVN